MSKPILCLDFDGVIHSYTSGWQGADVIPDPPVPGAIDFLRKAVKHFSVVIFSSRSNQPGGRDAMREWLHHYIIAAESVVIREESPFPPWFTKIEWPIDKPPAFVTIDDRAITFTGVWPSIDNLKNFKPWNKS